MNKAPKPTIELPDFIYELYDPKAYSSQPDIYKYAVPIYLPILRRWQVVDCYIVDREWNIDPQKPTPQPVHVSDLCDVEDSDITANEVYVVLRWIKNIPDLRIPEVRFRTPNEEIDEISDLLRNHVIGKPQPEPEKGLSVEDLQSIGYVGIYTET